MKKKQRGRPSGYKKIYAQKMIEFFDVEYFDTVIEKFYYKNGDRKEKETRVANKLPFISQFARSIGVNRDTLHHWANETYPANYKTKSLQNKLKHPEFSDAYKKAKEMQKEMLINNGLMGLYNPTSFIFTAKNIAGMRDNYKIEHKITDIQKIHDKSKEYKNLTDEELLQEISREINPN